MRELTEAWTDASAALPLGWSLDSLRCASTGLAPELRSDRWVAMACGPESQCLEAEGDGPIEALDALALRLREPPPPASDQA